jgi:hypothetical protein
MVTHRGGYETETNMPNNQKKLFQVHLSEAEGRFIRSLAAAQGMTHQQAMVAAFTAWAEKLGAATAATPPARAPEPRLSEPNLVPEKHPARPATANWLQKAAKLDWTRCPDVEVLQGKDRRLWVLCGTLAPLNELLQIVAEGHPLEDIAETFQLELPQLARVLEFAGATKC